MKNNKKNITHWETREIQLKKWVQTHHYEHPEFSKYVRDLNHARMKIEELQKVIII